MARSARVAAGIAVTDVFYRVIVRERLREYLGIIPKRPRAVFHVHALALHAASFFPDRSLTTRSRFRAIMRERRLDKEGFAHKTLALPPRAPRA